MIVILHEFIHDGNSVPAWTPSVHVHVQRKAKVLGVTETSEQEG